MGDKLPEQFSKYFKGTAYLNMLVPFQSEFNATVGNVTFEPVCRNNWHGAAKDSWFTHVTVETNITAGPPVWMESVSNEEYDKLK